jgi:HCOMODA/2-hydroxy-3-carboxy-muconic semialdehyde decarboxylase
MRKATGLLALLALCGGLAALAEDAKPIDPGVLDDLAAASRILADQAVVDAFGHVTVRHPTNPQHFLMTRSLAPTLATPADIVELDLDGNDVNKTGKTLFLERFIHAKIYGACPDVMAVVHSHSPAVIPFDVTKVPMRAMFHNSAFLARGVPVFDIREKFGATNMLVSNREIGRALAETLGNKAALLMRGHGDVIVAPTLPLAVFRAVYTEVNARLQAQAIGLGGPIETLTADEGLKAEDVNAQIVGRAWDLWKRRVAIGKAADKPN